MHAANYRYKPDGAISLHSQYLCRPSSSSSSRTSPNVLRAMEYANSIGRKPIGLTGRDGGKLAAMVGLNIQVPVPHRGRIEDGHMIGYYFMEEK